MFTDTNTTNSINLSNKFGIVPCEDFIWVSKQLPSTQALWLECWATDPFGSRWTPFSTSLAPSTFKRCKKILMEQGLFDFKVEKSTRDNRRTVGYVIKNLKGSRVNSNKSKSKFNRTSKRYQEFLQSDYWLSVRKSVLDRDKNSCQQCGCLTNLQVHHLSYKHHKKEHEHLEDLITLCDKCHTKTHQR